MNKPVRVVASEVHLPAVLYGILHVLSAVCYVIVVVVTCQLSPLNRIRKNRRLRRETVKSTDTGTAVPTLNAYGGRLNRLQKGPRSKCQLPSHKAHNHESEQTIQFSWENPFRPSRKKRANSLDLVYL